MNMDKSDNRKAESKVPLQQRQGLKYTELLMGKVIHDFNNIIGVVHGYASLALRNTSSNDSNYTYLKEILEGVNSAKDLAEKMRVFALPKDPEFQPVNIYAVVEETIKIFKQLPSGSIDIQQDMDVSCGSLSADADQIQQMVINLCNNACDAMRATGGILKITLKEAYLRASFVKEHACLNEGRYVKLTVSDTGHGMAEETLKQIFEPFFTTKKAGENFGLGLSIVYEIVKGHKGAIIAESQPGAGAVFDVYLPLG